MKEKIDTHIEAEDQKIEVIGARVHNLKNIDVDIPRNKLTVITGLSGSGKSSLAFDTIYAEGQRRYVETFSAYARQFLGNMERPDVDKIKGLSPVISIEQKTTNKNPRSTVGTVTEVYDFLRLLFARASNAYSYNTGEKMVRYTEAQINLLIFEQYANKAIYVLTPLVKGRKGHYRELFNQLIKRGFLQVRVNGKIKDLRKNMQLVRYQTHFIELVVDKLKVEENNHDRLKRSIDTAMVQGKGICMILEKDTSEPRFFSRHLMCPTSGISYNEPAPHNFSFNSPQGACPQCRGLGSVSEVQIDKIIPNTNKSIYNGGIEPLGAYSKNMLFWYVEKIIKKYELSLKMPIKNLPEEALDEILFGTLSDELSNDEHQFEGIISLISGQQSHSSSKRANKWAAQYFHRKTCPSCNGHRLRKESLHFKIGGKSIGEVSQLDISELYDWLHNVEGKMSAKQVQIAVEILKEIRTRTKFLLDVGLDYLSLNRPSRSLSGGESQRIRLATQIGSQLVNVLYILDEPSIGLHHRDSERLINSLKELRDIGNSIIVVEHDKDMMLEADHIIDIGPYAGRHGGEIVAQGTPTEILACDSLTAQYLNNTKQIELPEKRRDGNGLFIEMKGAKGNNLKNVNIKIPLGTLVCVTGVSGSGKSTLINETLHPILSRDLHRAEKTPLEYKKILGVKNIDKVIEVDQSPIGRTPRSNPATYTNVFGDIRSLFAELPEAKIRGYKPGRFSFNVKGGRCETCRGAGLQTIEMNFLPDVYVKCPTCYGRRYNRETLEVRYKGKSISDVLDMTINQAYEFFESMSSIKLKLRALKDVGLGYITLGQSSTTLSGGEAQRIKLASELARKSTGKTLYILDEPTTGLHFEDIKILMLVLNKLVDMGNTVIIIEHNLDVIKLADYIIDIGPEGGRNGGELICSGTPEKIIKCKKGYTAGFLKKELKL